MTIALALAALSLALSVGRARAVPRRTRALALSTESILSALLPMRVARAAMPPLARSVAIEIAATLAVDGELRFLALGDVSFRTRQRRANQPAMDEAVIFAMGLVTHRGGVGVGVAVARRLQRIFHVLRFGSNGHFYLSIGIDREIVGGGLEQRVVNRNRDNGAGTGTVWYVVQRPCLLPSRRRDLGLLVFVLGVARRAPRLLHILVDHGDDNVIGHAALARTVIVQNVTEPKPALLHELPRGVPFGWEMKTGADGLRRWLRSV
ncbi:MAG TPA: hypothetical protein VL173_01780, partial [Vicinamibacterales bacterium]|nr:hypothetical protein [Vicinamibacterales bacterium]